MLFHFLKGTFCRSLSVTPRISMTSCLLSIEPTHESLLWRSNKPVGRPRIPISAFSAWFPFVAVIDRHGVSFNFMGLGAEQQVGVSFLARRRRRSRRAGEVVGDWLARPRCSPRS